jgi:tetratricopeptide (TPR) repeat protein
MKVAFALRRVALRLPVTALLLPTHEVDRLLKLCARLGGDALPAIFAVADGFLLKLPGPTQKNFPGTMPLRSLAADLLIPADAELMPALLDDEASGLGRDQGLIFLPGNRVLAYAPRQPVLLSDLVKVGTVVRTSWQAFPEPRAWPARIQQILLEVPEPPAEELLEGGREDIGSEDPRPDEASLGAKVLGQGGMMAGKGMMSLGRLLHLSMLTDLGRRLIKNALERAPRLTEGILGRQEAALRWLLQQFREGRIEQALRRALPLGDPAERGPVVQGGSHLPFQNILYSLANLLGDRGGYAAVWHGGGDVHAQLLEEYRKAAEAAAAAGDYRRAAYIYGKLLRDFRTAANVLHQGGLHHDAAILYLTKVGDTLAAAGAFAAAGEIDRAVELFRQAGRHLEAGDLLRQAGEDEAAVTEYVIAADEVVAESRNYLMAGELLHRRAGRPDLARKYFLAGWSQRPAKNDIVCAIRAAEVDAAAGEAEPLLRLVEEAERYLRPPGNEREAGQFFTHLAHLADSPSLLAVRDDLRDLAQNALASKLRQRAALAAYPGNLVSDLFGQSGAWDNALVCDADFALKAALRPKEEALSRALGLIRLQAASREDTSNQKATFSRVQVGSGLVTAACYAPGSGVIFLGFQNSDVYVFRPSRSEVGKLPSSDAGCVSALATDERGQLVVALRSREAGPSNLMSYLITPEEDYRVEGIVASHPPHCSLAPLIFGDSLIHILGVWDESRLSFLRGPLLVSWGDLVDPEEGVEVSSALLLPSHAQSLGELAILVFCHGNVWYCARPRRERRRWAAVRWSVGRLGWEPCIPESNSLKNIPISWLWSAKTHLELAGLTRQGTLHWSVVDVGQQASADSLLESTPLGDADHDPQMLQIPARLSSVRPEGYLAATLIRAGHVAGVSRSHIDWLRAGSKEFKRWATTEVTLPGAVACFPSYSTRELIVVCRDGVVVRVPIPQG